MEPGIAAELAVAVATILVAAAIGWRVQQGLGAFFAGAGALLASCIVVVSSILGHSLRGSGGAWFALTVSCLVVGVLAAIVSNRIIRGRSGRFVACLWFGYCALCIIGYLAGGWIGLLTITLPAVVIFWIGLYRTSAYVFPLPDGHWHPQALHALRPDAFRCVLTHAMGTNYPYYTVREGKVELRVDGNPVSMLFAGPGLVLVDCDHTAYLTDGMRVKDLLQPGLNFTGQFDREPKAIDLRPQFCTFDVSATTQDGIRVMGNASIVFRVPRHAGRTVELGRPFAFRRQAIYQIAAQEPAGRQASSEETGDRFEWASELVPQIATRILQDVINYYGLDDLCASFGPDRSPCLEISNRLQQELRHELRPIGIELQRAWVSVLLPQDASIIERRIDNWKTEWERHILSLISEGRAEYGRKIEQARADAELKILLRFGQLAQDNRFGDTASQAALALRFIDCMGEIVSDAESQWPMPNTIREALQQLRGEIEEGQR
jgi:hypothetical protein